MKSQIDLFNRSFILHSDEDNEYIQSLVGYIKSKIDIIRDDVNTTDQLTLASLALLMITHELRSTKQDMNIQKSDSLDSIKKMITLLEDIEETSTI